jgi:hypothetical protein
VTESDLPETAAGLTAMSARRNIATLTSHPPTIAPGSVRGHSGNLARASVLFAIPVSEAVVRGGAAKGRASGGGKHAGEKSIRRRFGGVQVMLIVGNVGSTAELTAHTALAIEGRASLSS